MKYKKGMIAMAALSCFLLCGMQTSTSGCKSSGSIGPSTGQVVGVAVGVGAVVVGTVVLVEVHHSHHTIKGCVSTGPNGLQVENDSDKKLYTLVGNAGNVKAGDVVRLKGNKEKQDKGNVSSQEFVIEKVSKDYGPCKVPAVASSPEGRKD